MIGAFAYSAVDMVRPEYAGLSWLGIGTVFWIGVGALAWASWSPRIRPGSPSSSPGGSIPDGTIRHHTSIADPADTAAADPSTQPDPQTETEGAKCASCPSPQSRRNAVAHDLEATWQRFAAQARRREASPTWTSSWFPNCCLRPRGVPAPRTRRAKRGPRRPSPAPSPTGSALARRAEGLARAGLASGNARRRTALQHGDRRLPSGEIVARYRKLFPWRPVRDHPPGSEFVTFDIPGRGRIGLAICFDGSFPEVARQLAWLGAEVIIQPTLTTTRDREMEIVMSRANAFANQVYVVNVNGASPVGVGESVIVDPEGTIMQHAGAGEEILFAILDLDRVTQVRSYGTFGINRPWANSATSGRSCAIRCSAGRCSSRRPGRRPDAARLARMGRVPGSRHGVHGRVRSAHPRVGGIHSPRCRLR